MNAVRHHGSQLTPSPIKPLITRTLIGSVRTPHDSMAGQTAGPCQEGSCSQVSILLTAGIIQDQNVIQAKVSSTFAGDHRLKLDLRATRHIPVT